MRDLQKDLEVIASATPGPWFSNWENDNAIVSLTGDKPKEVVGLGFYAGYHLAVTQENANFVTEARTGWPEAIERAMTAEALNKELVEALEDLANNTRGINMRKCVKALAKAKEIE